MKTAKTYLKILMIGLIAVAVMTFNGCDKSDPFSPFDNSDLTGSANPQQPHFLKFRTGNRGFNKLLATSKMIHKATGGTINLNHGIAGGGQGILYAYASYLNIYKINPTDISHPELAGELEFRSAGIATHPVTGKVYYLSLYKIGDLYRVGVWDPHSNTNTVLPGGTAMTPAYKMTFGPDGTLYAVNRNNSRELYTIDTHTGEWTLAATFDTYLGRYGDMAFGPDGTCYVIDYFYQNNYLKVIDMSSSTITVVGQITGVGSGNELCGLGFASDGTAYGNTKDGKVYQIDLATAAASYAGDSEIPYLYDMASPYYEVELAYSDVTLEVLPNSIQQDTEIEISMESTELVGGVSVTFQPHGTVFDPPAVLNLEAWGVDLTGVDPNTVDIFYENPETGQWEPMPREAVIVDVANGKVVVVDARLPHFSRYGIASD